MFRSHPPGTFARVWRKARFFDQHVVVQDLYGAVLRCRYCEPYWERGKWLVDGRNYRRDTRNGWWEYDAGCCECIYFTKDGTLMTHGKRFLAVVWFAGYCFLGVHVCDFPSYTGVIDTNEDAIRWYNILPMTCLRKLCRTLLPRFQARLRAHCRASQQEHDRIGRFLLLRQWARIKLCNFGLNAVAYNSDTCYTKFIPAHFGRRGGYRVELHFSREDHRAYDPLWVDTAVYLPIGTRVWPAKDAAPGGVDACGWLWVKYRLKHWLREEAGWMHPDVIALDQDE